jgi:RNA polymerase sigma-70 factor (ECF subfamily)
MLRDRTLADDVHQSVFIDAFESMNSFQGRSSWRVWLYGIARHRCLDAAKVRRRWFQRFSLVPDAGQDDPDPEERGDDRLHAAQRARVLLDCLRQLPGHVRVAVLLRYEQGLSYEEIGAASRERPTTVQARVARALPVLRDCVTGKGASL